MKKKPLNIHLISPGFKVPPADFKITQKFWSLNSPSVNFFFDLRLTKKNSEDLLCSGTVDQRLLELKGAFADNSSDFVWALRGGYGSQELMPYLSKGAIKVKKTFMGFSDCTSLHYFLNQEVGLATLHAPHPNTFFKSMHSEGVLKAINKVLNLEDPEFLFTDLKLINKKALTEKLISKSLEANIGGGNLTTVVSLIGTPIFKGFEGKFLFLEEIDEPAYKVRRMLEHLKQSGALSKVKALLFGHMTHSSQNQEDLIKKVVIDFCNGVDIPSIWGISSGHFHSENYPLWFGKKSKLVLDESSTLVNNIKGE